MEEKKTFRFIKLPQVIKMTHLSKPSIYRLIKAGKFPPGKKLSERAVAWPEAVVLEWCQTRPVAGLER